METDYYTAFWGPLRLYIENLTTDGGRHQVTHEPSRGDAYVTQDKGRVLRKVRAIISFFDSVSGETESARDRYQKFVDLVDDGAEQVFVHPFHGSFLATVGPYTEDLDNASSVIRLSCEFIPAEPFEPVSDVGAGVVPVAGPEAVATLAAEADTALADAGITSTLPAETTALAESWSEASETDSRRIYLEAAAKVREIDDMASVNQLDSLETWQAYRAMMTLRAKLLDTAEAFTSEVSQTFDYVVQQEIPLLTLCSRLYGAGQAPVRARQVASINDLKNALVLRPGTYKMPLETGAR